VVFTSSPSKLFRDRLSYKNLSASALIRHRAFSADSLTRSFAKPHSSGLCLKVVMIRFSLGRINFVHRCCVVKELQSASRLDALFEQSRIWSYINFGCIGSRQIASPSSSSMLGPHLKPIGRSFPRIVIRFPTSACDSCDPAEETAVLSIYSVMTRT